MKDYSINELISDKITGEWGDELTDSDGTKILRTTNFTNEGRLNFASVVERKIKPEIVEKKKLLPGDIIVEKSGGSPSQPVGRVVYFDVQNEIFLCNNFTAVLRPSNKVYPKYLFYALFNFHLTNRTLRYQNKTTGILNLKLERYLNEERISLPSFDTQQKIAQILSEADKARQLRKQANALTDQFLQSTFLSMFGDPVSNPKGWEMKKIGDVALKTKNGIKAGPFGSSLKKEYYVSDGYKIYGQEQVIKDDLNFGDYYIDEARFKALQSCEVKAGDILISLVGTYGKISIVPTVFKPGIINPRLMKISPDKNIIDSLFFKFLLTTDAVKKQISHFSRGGTMDIINVQIIKNIQIIVPPIKLQQQFADIVAETEQLRQRQRAHEQELEQLFKGLLQKYFG